MMASKAYERASLSGARARVPLPESHPAHARLQAQLAEEARRGCTLADAARLSTIEAVAGRIEPSFLEEESSTSAEGAVLGATPEGGIVIGGAVEPQARRAASVLRHMPWSLPFGSRLGLLRRWLGC